jgi:hypothetical protein
MAMGLFNVLNGKKAYKQSSHIVGRPPPRGAQVVCMRDTFILIEIWTQYKIYISVGTSLSWNILLISQYWCWLRTVSSTFCQRI